jgi:hypothetical protein
MPQGHETALILEPHTNGGGPSLTDIEQDLEEDSALSASGVAAVRPAVTPTVSTAGSSSAAFLPQNGHSVSPSPAGKDVSGRGDVLPPAVSSYLPPASSAHGEQFLGHMPHGDGGHGPLAVPPPPPSFLLDPKVPSPYGSVYGSMASLNTSLDCQPADLSIGSTGKVL